jgi:quercetin dioxygenase-like cupin family protein
MSDHGVSATSQRIFRWRDQETYLRGSDVFQILDGEQMHFARAVLPPGAEYEMHSHPQEQFSLLLSGRLLLTVGDEKREIGPGDGWYVPGGVDHGGHVLGDEPAIFIDAYSKATEWTASLLNAPDVRKVPSGTKTTVVHNQHDEYDVYIGRAVPEAGLEASKWGNPIVLADDSDEERKRVIVEYRAWVLEQPELLGALAELRGLRLGCWCAPKLCHGDVLAELADQVGT